MPNDYATPAPPEVTVRNPRTARRNGLIAAGPCWAVLVTAWLLTARSGGYGTHEQLGLSACGSMMVHGVPCPTCGLTTSVTAAVHGDFAASVRANVFGLVLFAAVVAAAVIGTLQAVTGRNMLGRFVPRPWWKLPLIAVGGVLAGWAIKLAVGYTAGQYPTH